MVAVLQSDDRYLFLASPWQQVLRSDSPAH